MDDQSRIIGDLDKELNTIDYLNVHELMLVGRQDGWLVPTLYPFPDDIAAVQDELQRVSPILRDLRTALRDMCANVGVDHDAALTYGHDDDNARRMCLKCRKEVAESHRLQRFDGYAYLDEDEDEDGADVGNFTQDDADDMDALLTSLSNESRIQSSSFQLSGTTTGFSIGDLLRFMQICIDRLSSIQLSLSFHLGIHSLPQELLSTIFQFACEQPSSSHHTLERYQAHMSALHISHVNQHFRDISLHTHDIWCNISNMQCSKHILACLARSKGHNLNICYDTSLIFTGPDSYIETLSLPEFMPLILPHTSQWISWTYADGEDSRCGHAEPEEDLEDPETIAYYRNLDLPILKQLSIHGVECSPSEIDNVELSNFVATLNTPRLTSFVGTNVFPSAAQCSTIRSMAIKIDQYTCRPNPHNSFIDLASCLQQCGSLQALDLHMPQETNFENNVAIRVTNHSLIGLPNLQVFKVQGELNLNLPLVRFLSSLEIPNVRRLDLVSFGLDSLSQADIAHLPTFSKLKARASQMLAEVTLDCPEADVELQSAFNAFSVQQNIRHLTIKGKCLILENFTDFPPLSHLQSLVLENCELWNESLADKFIQWRKATVQADDFNFTLFMSNVPDSAKQTFQSVYQKLHNHMGAHFRCPGW